MSPESKIAHLKDRALAFSRVRSFFSKKKVLEVDTPILSHSAPIDEHIDVMSVNLINTTGYLHTSPEYAMKRLLSIGIGDIYQLGHVFRLGEVGKRHNPEFTMIEWYRIGMPFLDFIKEVLELIQLFLGPLPSSKISYREALKTYAGIDYINASQDELLKCAYKNGIELSTEHSWEKEDLLHLLMGSIVEPNLGKNELLVLSDYPASQAALAKTEVKEGEVVAKRFEIYYQGVELANGYLELTDPKEQRNRFIESNKKRAEMGKETLPLDENLLLALRNGVPECCGVAVGFDRLFMLKQKTDTIGEILPFHWDEV
jgi:elongation factor P--(R)-beta-lysine ligase